MVSNGRLGIVPYIIRFCGTSKDKVRIMNRLGLNEVQAESYLTILTQQSMIMQNNEKYVTTTKGHDYLSSYERLRKIVF
jgi:predicted transcriptional regulator